MSTIHPASAPKAVAATAPVAAGAPATAGDYSPAVRLARFPSLGDALLAVRTWLAWHPKTRWALIFMAVCTVCHLLNISPAFAADGQGGSTVYGLPIGDVTDTHGISIAEYSSLPIQGPVGIEPVAAGREILINIFWTAYSLGVYLVIALVNFVMGFTWLDWIASPFLLLSNSLSLALGQMGIISLGIAVSSLIIVLGWVRGRMGAALVELLMVVFVAGLIATDVGAPSTYLTGEDGWIQQSSSTGEDLGSAVVNTGTGTDEEDQVDSSDPASGQLADMMLREPALTMSFGSNLEGLTNAGNEAETCDATWDNVSDPESDHYQSDMEERRKTVAGCHEAAKAASESNSLVALGTGMQFAMGSTAIEAIILVFVFFLIMACFEALWRALETTVKAYFALFTPEARISFFRSLAHMTMQIGLVIIYIVGFVGVLWMINEYLPLLPGTAQLRSTLIGLITLILGVLYWRLRKSGTKISDALSDKLGRTGLAKNSAPRRDGGMREGAGKLARSGTRTAGNLVRDQLKRRGVQKLATAAGGAATGGAATATMAAANAARKRYFPRRANTGNTDATGSGASKSPATAQTRMTGTSPRAQLPAGSGGAGAARSNAPTPAGGGGAGRKGLAAMPKIPAGPSSRLPRRLSTAQPGPGEQPRQLQASAHPQQPALQAGTEDQQARQHSEAATTRGPVHRAEAPAVEQHQPDQADQLHQQHHAQQQHRGAGAGGPQSIQRVSSVPAIRPQAGLSKMTKVARAGHTGMVVGDVASSAVGMPAAVSTVAGLAAATGAATSPRSKPRPKPASSPASRANPLQGPTTRRAAAGSHPGLPPGRHGNVRVTPDHNARVVRPAPKNTGGDGPRAVSGPVVKNMPSEVKVARAWVRDPNPRTTEATPRPAGQAASPAPEPKPAQTPATARARQGQAQATQTRPAPRTVTQPPRPRRVQAGESEALRRARKTIEEGRRR